MTTMLTQLPDENELVTRARAGDLGALDDLITLLRPPIFRYCRFRLSSYVGGGDAADDAAQETCLAVATVLPGYQDHGFPFRAWVYGIAANKVADSQRRFRRAAVLLDEFPEQVEPSQTPEERLMASVEMAAALALVEQLPARLRQVLVMRSSGETAASVGEALGISAGAVNVAHHRAVVKVRELVDSSEELRELFAFCRDRGARRPLGRAA